MTARSNSVTELALLTLPPSAADATSPLTPTLKGALSRARIAMERVSGQPFAYVHCATGPQNQLFIVGGWPSVQFHMEEWIPSVENQALVKEFGELGVGVKWMWHVGVERPVVERVVLGGAEWKAKVRIWRAAVARERVGEVQSLLGVVRQDASGLGRAVMGGFRLDEGFMAEGEKEKSLRNEEEGRDEVVLLARLDGLGGAIEEVDKALGRAQSLVEKWEVSDGVVLDV